MAASSIGRTSVVVPEEYSTSIIQAAIRESAVLQLARKLPMGRLIEHLPVMSALPTGGFVNPRDTGKKVTANLAWQNVILTAEEIGIVVPIPTALLDDAGFDIFGEVQPRIGEAFGAIIDAACLFGTNAPASWPAGGIYASAYNADNRYVAGTAVDVAQDINNTMAMVEADGFDANGFVGLYSLKAQLRGLRATSSGVLLFAPSLIEGTPDMLYGEKITYSRNASMNAALATLFTGDWSMAAVGIRQDMRAQVFDQGVLTNADGTVALSLMEQDMVALRCYMRLGFAIANPITIQQGGSDRTVADGVLNSTTTVTSATAAFVAADVGKAVVGTGIPTGAVIASRTNATTIVLSAAATATANGVTLTVSNQRSPFAILEPVGGQPT
jgi:HK97 family phage major capsid protein